MTGRVHDGQAAGSSYAHRNLLRDSKTITDKHPIPMSMYSNVRSSTIPFQRRLGWEGLIITAQKGRRWESSVLAHLRDKEGGGENNEEVCEGYW